MPSGKTIWMLISSMPADRRRCCVRSRIMRPGMELNVIFPWRSAWPAGSVLAWAACAKAKKRMRTAMCITNGSARTDRFSWLRRWKSDEYENQYCRCGMEKSCDSSLRDLRIRGGIFRVCGSEPVGCGDDQGCGKCAVGRKPDAPRGRGLRRHDECHRPPESGSGCVLRERYRSEARRVGK